MRTRTAALLVAGLAFLASACDGNPIDNAVDNVVEDAVENGVENAVEQNSGGDVDINVGSNASLPDDFPSDVPMPSGGDIISSVKVDNSWSVNYAYGDDSAVSDLVDEFKSSGWTEVGTQDLGEFKAWIFENDTYSINIGAVYDTDAVTVSYTVTEKQ